MVVEDLIFSNLIFNEGYGRKVIPFLVHDYFSSRIDKEIFKAITGYVDRFNSFPNQVALSIELENARTLSQDEFVQAKQKIDTYCDQQNDVDWLVDQTEKFCKDRAIYNAISESIKILDDKSGKTNPNSIPSLLEQALSVSFDTQIGHDFFDDVDQRYDFYHKKEERIPFDIDFLNKISKGGLPRKTLNVALAGTGVGKSLFMCHCAAANIVQGKNVLYITMEMAEERIAERIDANLMNVTVDDLALLPRDAFEKKIQRVKEKTVGKLIIKEYPTSSAGAANFRHLLNELSLKKKFKPDIIYIDYLNICASSRLKQSANVNSYTYVKAIAEEIRGLAVEFNVPIVSATQTNRAGYSSSDVGLENTSESFGLPATVDMMFAIISSEELEDLNQLMFKQLKNRYADPSKFRKFVVGVDRAKMKLYDVEQSAQDDLMPDTALFDKDTNRKFTKDIFKGFS